MENITEIKKMIDGCRDNCQRSQKELYFLYFNPMMGVCMRYARDRSEARDMLHEGYIKVYLNLSKYTFKGSFMGWMRRIMVHEAINYFHRTNKGNKMMYSDQMHVIQPNYNMNGEELITGDLAVQEVLEMVQALPPSYRMVFNLYAIEGYTHKEIAEKLGVTIGTSKSNLFAVRKKLQQQVSALNSLQARKYA